ncbi:MAG: GntR family transcriptional regulator [Proteobacteria bacterium]|nr:GntR family transcriptional regulator [Pseudomonadota bacterium]
MRNKTDKASRTSLRELAIRSIRDLIATRRIKPGEYINERALVKELGIGRTPTHQALEELTLTKLVQFIPGRGSIVRPIGPQEVLRLTEARVINEELSARLAARHATPNDVDELSALIARAEHWTALRNIERLVLLDRTFHATIARISANAVLQDILSGLHERALGYWFVVASAPSRLAEISSEHEAVFEAIRAKDEDRAGRAMRDHLESFQAAIDRTFFAPVPALEPDPATKLRNSGQRSRGKPQYAAASPSPPPRDRGALLRRSRPRADPGKTRDDHS